MTQEEKQLLLKDLCARLPYGIKCKLSADGVSIVEDLQLAGLSQFLYGRLEVIPYLRPMSSMTEEEADEWAKASNMKFDMEDGFFDAYDAYLSVDWLNENMFDYRGLIPMGLALEAREGMYKTD